MKLKIKDLILMTSGTLITAVGIYCFKFPNNFCTGGVSGVSVIIGRLAPGISPETVIAVLNIAFLLLGIVFIGRSFSFKTIYCSTLLSGFVFLLEGIYPVTAPITSQPILELFFAIAMSAFGSAVLFECEASSGGTDILAMIIKKFSSMNISRALFFADAVIVMFTFFVFGTETWLFSVVGFTAKIFLTNSILEKARLSKFCTVITSPEHEKDISNFITEKLCRTATISNTYSGAYEKERKCVFLVALTGKECVKLKKYIKILDEKAFIVASNTFEISGKGFKDMI